MILAGLTPPPPPPPIGDLPPASLGSPGISVAATLARAHTAASVVPPGFTAMSPPWGQGSVIPLPLQVGAGSGSFLAFMTSPWRSHSGAYVGSSSKLLMGNRPQHPRPDWRGSSRPQSPSPTVLSPRGRGEGPAAVKWLLVPARALGGLSRQLLEGALPATRCCVLTTRDAIARAGQRVMSHSFQGVFSCAHQPPSLPAPAQGPRQLQG